MILSASIDRNFYFYREKSQPGSLLKWIIILTDKVYSLASCNQCKRKEENERTNGYLTLGHVLCHIGGCGVEVVQGRTSSK